jgi:hypothetical protein
LLGTTRAIGSVRSNGICGWQSVDAVEDGVRVRDIKRLKKKIHYSFEGRPGLRRRIPVSD